MLKKGKIIFYNKLSFINDLINEQIILKFVMIRFLTAPESAPCVLVEGLGYQKVLY